MIFEWNLKHGLVVGLQQETVLGYDESIGDAFEASAIVLHLGPLELRWILGIELADPEED